MDGNTKTYLIDGNPVDVKEQDVSTFKAKYPKAIEAQSFILNGSDTVDVAISDVDKFKSKYPEAKPTFADTPPPKAPKENTNGMAQDMAMAVAPSIMADGSKTTPKADPSLLADMKAVRKNVIKQGVPKADLNPDVNGIKKSLMDLVVMNNEKGLNDLGVKATDVLTENQQQLDKGTQEAIAANLKPYDTNIDTKLQSEKYRNELANKLSIKNPQYSQKELYGYLTQAVELKGDLRKAEMQKIKDGDRKSVV